VVPARTKTLIGYDPEHGGEDALALGKRFADVLDGEVEVVSVLPWARHLADSEDLQREVDAELERHFAAARERLAGVEVSTRGLAHPSPAQVLAAIADDEDVAVIVIGSAHRGEVGRTLLGTVGQSLAHGVSRPIAVAPRGYADAVDDRLDRVAVAYDGSPESETALEAAVGIARHAGAQLTVLTVADYPRYTRAAAWSLVTEGEINDRERAHRQELVDAAVAGLPDGLTAAGRVLTGDPARELTAATADFDLLVAGARSFGPVRRVLLGSTTRRLLGESTCPVLVMPRDAEPLL
jgi:nucleotide-binding universal stress UspA family protein